MRRNSKKIIAFILAVAMCITAVSAQGVSSPPATTSAISNQSNPSAVQPTSTLIPNQVSIAILMDSSFQSYWGSSHLQKAEYLYTYASYPFSLKWNIIFNPSYAYVGLTPIDNCPNGLLSACSSSCGTNADCKTMDNGIHHKSDAELLTFVAQGIEMTTHDMVTMWTATTMCNYDGASHTIGLVWGRAGMPSGNSVTTTTQSYEIPLRVIQHEWSHNFGCYDNVCNGICIMSGGYDSPVYSVQLADIWCSACEADFNPNAL